MRWIGESFVAVVGVQSAQIDASRAQHLIEKFREAGFWWLCDGYAQEVTDSATYFTRLHLSGQTKEVSDYADSAPAWLLELGVELDALTDTHRWRHGPPAEEQFGRWNLQVDSFGHKPGVTPLMQAAGRDDFTAVATLLTEGVTVDARDSSGWTALMYAARISYPGIVQQLLMAGANPRLRSHMGQTAVMAATVAPIQPEAKLLLLLAASGDINAQDQDGQTALMMAAHQYWRKDLVLFILSAGADPRQRDRQDRSALEHLNEEFHNKRSTPMEYDKVRTALQRVALQNQTR